MSIPLVNVGDSLRVHWPDENGNFQWYVASVMTIEKLEKLKRGSQYKYTLLFEDGDVVISTLVNKDWERVTSEDAGVAVMEVITAEEEAKERTGDGERNVKKDKKDKKDK